MLVVLAPQRIGYIATINMHHHVPRTDPTSGRCCRSPHFQQWYYQVFRAGGKGYPPRTILVLSSNNPLLQGRCSQELLILKQREGPNEDGGKSWESKIVVNRRPFAKVPFANSAGQKTASRPDPSP